MKQGWGTSIRGGIALTAVIFGGAVSTPPAGAAATMSVTPTSGLTDGQTVTVTVTASQLGWLGQCGNTYADGTPLPPGGPTLGVDCSGPIGPGPVISPASASNAFSVRRSGIGTGNRSCVQVAPRPCTIWGMGDPVPITFAADAPGTPMPTATTVVSAPSLPVSAGKDFGLRIWATAAGGFRPDGAVTVTDGTGVVATGTLTRGEAVVTVPGQTTGSHQFEAHYVGNGSFASSDSIPATVTTSGPDSIAINDISMYESTGGQGTANFAVRLSRPATGPVTVKYAVTPGSAIAGTDFKLVHGGTGTLTFAPGNVAKYINVPVLFNATITTPKTFFVTLSAPTGGYALGRAVGTGTFIQPHDFVTSPHVAPVSIAEGDSGGNTAVKIPIVFTRPTTTAGTISITITRITAVNGAKNGGGDFTGSLTRQIAYKAGTVQKTLGVTVFPDTRAEGDETFQVTAGGVSSIITILGDD